MQIYIHRNNQQLGPFTEDEVKAQLAAGTLSAQDHVWWQGQQGWIPLAQSFLVTGATPPVPGAPAVPPTATAAVAGGTAPTTSSVAIAALVCGCLSIICSIFTAIPAIILGHMGMSQTRKNPALQGRGMALAGLILGYVFTAFGLLYISIVGTSVLIALANHGHTFTTIESPLRSDTNDADQSTTNSDQSGATPATNSPDQMTTNAPDQSTNGAPSSTNSPDMSTNGTTPGTNSPDSATTNAAPMSQ
jgi:hypothetical protein